MSLLARIKSLLTGITGEEESLEKCQHVWHGPRGYSPAAPGPRCPRQKGNRACDIAELHCYYDCWKCGAVWFWCPKGGTKIEVKR